MSFDGRSLVSVSIRIAQEWTFCPFHILFWNYTVQLNDKQKALDACLLRESELRQRESELRQREARNKVR